MEELGLSELAEVINRLHGKTRDPALRKDIDDYMCGLDCGQFLLDARSQLQQDEWEVWVRDYLAFDIDKAETYMRRYRDSF